VESSCELVNEPSGSIKCWELPNGCTTFGLSSGTQLHRVSYLVYVQHSSGTVGSSNVHTHGFYTSTGVPWFQVLLQCRYLLDSYTVNYKRCPQVAAPEIGEGACLQTTQI
jgi:hypothetical protein